MTKEAKNFKRFSEAGRDLAKWHVNYETVEPYPLKEETGELALDPKKHYIVEKMAFPRKGKEIDKSRIIYNSCLTLSGIPLKAYEYVVNGKSAIEWIIERYQVTKDPDSGIVNDPNDWAREHEDPQYILNLLKRIVTVSVETMKIVKSPPPARRANLNHGRNLGGGLKRRSELSPRK
jgi:predicted helicase